MTLQEVAQDLGRFSPEWTIYADRICGRLASESPAIVARGVGILTVTGDGRVTQVVGGKAWEVVAGVARAQQAIALLRQWGGLAEPAPAQALEAILYYAEHHSFLPVGSYYEQEHAEAIDLGVQADQAAPDPTALVGEHLTLLAFYLEEVNGSEYSDLAVIEFAECRAARWGPPAEDAVHQHPLWGKGLQPYGAFIVRNSTWVAEIERLEGDAGRPAALAEAVQGSHASAGAGRALTHYFLSFHDSTFECVASGFRVRAIVSSMEEAFGLFLRP